MEDFEENAVIVNALQRGADVVVQKSLAEGFGLTVAEAMWKRRPVVASRIGGIQDQIEHGVSGLLLDDPADLEAYGAAVLELLASPERAAAMGDAAHERVRDRFLGTHRCSTTSRSSRGCCESATSPPLDPPLVPPPPLRRCPVRWARRP